MKFLRQMAIVGLLVAVASAQAWGEWKPQTVRHMVSEDTERHLPAKIQIVSEKWDRVSRSPFMAQAIHPNIVYMPEKNRVLMLFVCDRRGNPSITYSDDGGNAWSDPQCVKTDPPYEKFKDAWSHSLTDLGKGNLVLLSAANMNKGATYTLWYSHDFGQTWTDPTFCRPMSNGHKWATWDPMLADIDPKTGKVVNLIQTGFDIGQPGKGKSGVFIRFSKDVGKTWHKEIQVPQWKKLNEINLKRAKNGNLVAACRTDLPKRFEEQGTIDHYSGLMVSTSKDNGNTWSEPYGFFEWGRHHPSLVNMPNGDIVMTYVVRKGYVDLPDGHPQFGIEAVVSRDNGQTWDLDHKYILAQWRGAYTGPGVWYPSSQSTSSVLMPDGSMLTAFGTGELCDDKCTRRDAAVIRWRLDDKPVGKDSKVRDAAFESDARNVFDPAPRKNIEKAGN